MRCEPTTAILFPGQGSQSTGFAQPAIFCASLAGWTRVAGHVEPLAFAGQSLGELTAPAAAGAVDEADALRLVVARGRLMADSGEDARVLEPEEQFVARARLSRAAPLISRPPTPDTSFPTTTQGDARMATATTQDIETTIVEHLVKFGAEPDAVSREATLEDIDVDSLDLVELIQVVEDTYGIDLENADFKHIETVGDVVDLVAARVQG